MEISQDTIHNQPNKNGSRKIFKNVKYNWSKDNETESDINDIGGEWKSIRLNSFEEERIKTRKRGVGKK